MPLDETLGSSKAWRRKQAGEASTLLTSLLLSAPQGQRREVLTTVLETTAETGSSSPNDALRTIHCVFLLQYACLGLTLKRKTDALKPRKNTIHFWPQTYKYEPFRTW